MAKKKSPYGKYSASEYRENLERLSAYYGSQKKAAEKIGISPATFRNHLQGKSQPKPGTVAKTNRIFGQNRSKIQSEDVDIRLEKQRKRRTAVQARNQNKVSMISTSSWLSRTYPNISPESRGKILGIAPYVRYQGSDDSNVQFTDGFDVEGRPPKTRAVDAWVYFTAFTSLEGEMIPDESVPREVTKVPIDTVFKYQKQVTIPEVLAHIDKEMTGRVELKGKKKYVYSELIGYQLRSK